MYRRIVRIGLVWLVTVAAATAQQKGPSASDGWVRLPAAGETSARAFALVDNPGMYDIYLVSASSDVAEKVELRQAGPDGTLGAKPVEITVPAYGSISMEPKGAQMLLLGLKKPLAAGDTIPLTIKTEVGVEISVSATVKKE